MTHDNPKVKISESKIRFLVSKFQIFEMEFRWYQKLKRNEKINFENYKNLF